MISDRLRRRLKKDRPMQTVSINMPTDVVEELLDLALKLGLPDEQALIRMYISAGLRNCGAESELPFPSRTTPTWRFPMSDEIRYFRAGPEAVAAIQQFEAAVNRYRDHIRAVVVPLGANDDRLTRGYTIIGVGFEDPPEHWAPVKGWHEFYWPKGRTKGVRALLATLGEVPPPSRWDLDRALMGESRPFDIDEYGMLVSYSPGVERVREGDAEVVVVSTKGKFDPIGCTPMKASEFFLLKEANEAP